MISKKILHSSALCAIIGFSGCGDTGTQGSNTSNNVELGTITVVPASSTSSDKLESLESKISKPTAPKNQRVSVKDGIVYLTWSDTSNNESGFKILRDGKLITTTDASVTGYVDMDAESGMKHTYSIVAFNKVGKSSCNVSCNVEQPKPIIPAPLTPVNFSATATSDSVELTWDSDKCSKCTSNYRIYRNGSFVVMIDGDNSRYTDTALIPNSDLTYTIYASNPGGTADVGVVHTRTADVNTAITPPLAPSNLTAAKLESNFIKLTWSDNATTENAYQVFRNGILVCTGDADLVSNYVTDLDPDTTYTFTVKAVNGGGASSTEITILTPSAQTYLSDKAPAAVSDVSANMNAAGEVELSWNNNATDNIGYKIYRNGCLVVCLDNPSTTTFVDKCAKAGEDYTYDVRAFNHCGATPTLETVVLKGGDSASVSKDAIPVITPLNPTYPLETVTEDKDGNTVTTSEPVVYSTKEDVTFKSSDSIDPDNKIAKVQWFDANGNLLSTGPDFTKKFTTPGAHTIKMVTTDVNGKQRVVTKTITVVANKAPLCRIERLYNQKHYIGDAIPYDGSQSTDDSAIATYEWSRTNFGTVVGTGSKISPDYIYTEVGTYPMYLKVTDDQGLSRVCARWVRVRDTTGRPVSIATVDGQHGLITAYDGDSVELNNDGSYDQDGSIVGYKWQKYSPGQGWRDISTNENTTDTVTAVNGNRTIYIYRLIVEDNDGKIDDNRNNYEVRRELRVEVRPSTEKAERPVAIPTLNGEWGAKFKTIGNGEKIYLNASDSYDRPTSGSGSIVKYEWFRYGGGQGWKSIGEGVELEDTLPTATRLVRYQYYLKVTDNDSQVDNSINGFTDGKERRFLRVEIDPDHNTGRPSALAVINEISDTGVNTIEAIDGDILSLDATNSFDENGNIVSYQWLKYGGGQGWHEISTDAETEDTVTLHNDRTTRYLYMLKVEDNEGKKDSSFDGYDDRRIFRVNVIKETPTNKRPIALATANDEHSRTWKEIAGSSKVLLSAEGSKDTAPDNDAIVKYEWFRAGTGEGWHKIGEGITYEDTLPAARANALSRYHYYLKITDADGRTDLSLNGTADQRHFMRFEIPKAGNGGGDNGDTVKPISRFLIDGKASLTINPGPTKEVTIDASTSTDNVGVVKYKFEKSENGPNGDYSVIYEGANSSVNDTPSGTLPYVNNVWSRTYYKVTVYDANGNESTQQTKRYVQVRK